MILLFIFRRVIIGLTQFTNKAHIARATLEAVCFQTREVSAIQNSGASNMRPCLGEEGDYVFPLLDLLLSQFCCQLLRRSLCS